MLVRPGRIEPRRTRAAGRCVALIFWRVSWLADFPSRARRVASIAASTLVVREVLGAPPAAQGDRIGYGHARAGYQATMSPKGLRDAVAVVLRQGEYK
jgi:hypothetical protein